MDKIMNYKNMSVLQLRSECKECGIKNYAWKKKAELIFDLAHFSIECPCCHDELNIDEMNSYIKHYTGQPRTENSWTDDDYYIVPCCSPCHNWNHPVQCHRCQTWWGENQGIEWAYLPNSEEVIICEECRECESCHQLISTIREDNWDEDEDPICDNCKECSVCEELIDIITKDNRNKDGYLVCNGCKKGWWYTDEIGNKEDIKKLTDILKSWEEERDLIYRSILYNHKLINLKPELKLLLSSINKWERQRNMLDGSNLINIEPEYNEAIQIKLYEQLKKDYTKTLIIIKQIKRAIIRLVLSLDSTKNLTDLEV